jgi:phosphopantothenoylcysteine decarboxylase/phosphopantothenate--cysteine ligase
MGASRPPAAPQGRKILLCVTGGIAAYKVVQVARDLTELGADVRVVMTEGARHFVGAQTFAGVTGNPVSIELFTDSADAPHVELARGADLAIVAPATANAVAKLAHGISDDLFSATALMLRCPMLVAPAMHTEMWESPATQQNVQTISRRGAFVLGPATGRLMSGDVGAGRMVEPEEIVQAALGLLARGEELAGRRFLVTAGGTQEPIDPVRFIGNRSSGLMGFTIAKEAVLRGAKVALIAGPTQLTPPPGVEVIAVRTAEEMRREVLARAPDVDAIVKAAAVADWSPEHAAGTKLKKAKGAPDIRLVPTPDILAELGSPEHKPPGVLVGFAAETEIDPAELGKIAEEKRRAKGADLIVANDVSSPDSGFAVPTNRAVIASPEGITDVGLVTKEELARALLDQIAHRLAEPTTQ